ncbi:MAG TPA: hypothetical protein VEU96_18510 [Bryobacteraceae bacterium]|nr:hypothetical protein [Bryobacteraceae bacterium]
MARRSILLLFLAISASPAADPRAASVTHKLDIIESGKARPGAVFVFPSADLNAWARVKASEAVPEGLRQPRLELGNNTATGYALIDFLKVRHGAGVETNWLVAKIIQGEKPVKAIARIQSARGRATVHLQRVEIGGLAVSGATLDFLIETFLQPLYPNAKIDEPFDLAGHIDHLEITPTEVRVYIKK